MPEERLPWHQDLWRGIQQRRGADRLPHALLLAGPVGLGKGRFARRLARALLCAHPETDAEACGQCSRCRLFEAGSHPDYRLVQPEEDGKAIKVDQIRALSAFLGYTAQYGGYKIALVEPADRLNSAAANSLLKTLEEPPGLGLLLLVTAWPARLPATVRSRCQKISFTPPTAAAALPWLSARSGGDFDPAALLAMSGGAPLAALSQVEGQRWQRRRALFSAYERVLSGQADPIRMAEEWARGDLIESLRWLIDWHTDLVRLKMSSNPPRLNSPDLQDALRRWAASATSQVLFERLDAVVRLHSLCTTTQVNAPLLLEAFLSEATP